MFQRMNGLPFSDKVQGSKLRKTVTLAVNCLNYIYISISQCRQKIWNGPRRLKLEPGRNFWKWVKHGRLCSVRENICQLWVPNKGDLNFFGRSVPVQEFKLVWLN